MQKTQIVRYILSHTHLSLSGRANLVWACDDSNHLPSCQTLLMFIRTYDYYVVVGKCKFCRLYLYTIKISQQKNGVCLDSSQLLVFQPLSICTCGSEAKCKPAVTVSFQLFCTQENDSEIDSDFDDFDSDEESDSELVW